MVRRNIRYDGVDMVYDFDTDTLIIFDATGDPNVISFGGNWLDNFISAVDELKEIRKPDSPLCGVPLIKHLMGSRCDPQ